LEETKACCVPERHRGHLPALSGFALVFAISMKTKCLVLADPRIGRVELCEVGSNET